MKIVPKGFLSQFHFLLNPYTLRKRRQFIAAAGKYFDFGLNQVELAVYKVENEHIISQQFFID
jgi:hypothetical protein